MSVAAVDPRRAPAGNLAVRRNEEVDEALAGEMAALGEYGSACADGISLRRDLQLRLSLDAAAGQRRQFRRVGRYQGGDVGDSIERGDRRLVRKDGTAAGDHDRIEDDRKAWHNLTGQTTRDRLHRLRRSDHPDLDGVRADIGKHRLHLLNDHLGRNRHHRRDAERILRRDRGNRRRGEAAEHGNGLDIGLDASAAARIGTGDDQHAGRLHAGPFRIVAAGCFARWRSARVGRGRRSPPQFGQVPSSTSSTQAVQNVHSNEQICAWRLSGGRSTPQLSQSGLISSAMLRPPLPLRRCCRRHR